MKSSKWIIAALIAVTPTLAFAEGDHADKKNACHKPCGKERREAILKKFDTDGDGKLNETERASLQEERKQKKAERIAKYDTDGDGKLSKEERKAAMDAFRAEYDTDGDGKLSKEERKAAHEAGAQPPFRKHHKKHCHRKHRCEKKSDKAGDE